MFLNTPLKFSIILEKQRYQLSQFCLIF
jgi:hypothetical protein